MNRILLAVLGIWAILISGAGSLFADEKVVPLRLPVPEDALEEGTLYYSATMKGTKIGWMSEGTSRKTRLGREVICVRVITHTETRSFGAEIKAVEMEEDWFDTEPPHRFLGGRKTTTSGGTVQHIEVVPAEGKETGTEFQATIKEAGTTKVRDWDPGEFQLADISTPTAWFRKGPKVGESVTTRALSIGSLETSTTTMTVGRVPKSEDGILTYLAKVVDSEEGEIGVAEVDVDGEVVEMRIGGGAFVIRKEGEEAARLIAVSEVDMFSDNIVKMEEKLGDAGEIEEMVLKVTGAEVGRIPSGPEQLAEFDAESGVLTLKIGRRYGVESVAEEKELEKALKDTLVYPAKDSAVVKLAKRAVKKAGEGRAEQVGALVRFVDRFIEDDMTAEPLTVADIMAVRSGDCTEHALLFVTLARSLGIPAREVSGLYYADEIGGFGGHAWAEVEIDGKWNPVNPAWNETWTDAAHIRIYTEGVSDYAQQAVQMSGDIKIEVKEAKRRGGE